MAQRAFVKVVGFSAAERHALNTAFRLSDEGHAPYALWAPGASEPPALLLLDGESADAASELESPYAHNVKLIWVGANASAQAQRVFERPIAWPQVIQAIDALFGWEPSVPAGDDAVDLDLGGHTDAMDTQPPDMEPLPDQQPHPRALIVSADHDQRLYLRARLSLAGLTFVDEAQSGGQAVELAKRLTYQVAIVEHRPPQVDAWTLLKRLREVGPDRPSVILTKARGSILDRLRAWSGGTSAFLSTPPNPVALERALRKALAERRQRAPALPVQQPG